MFYKWFADKEITKFGTKRRLKTEKMYLDRLFRFTKKGDKILELGPGEGTFAGLCKEQGFEYTGIEASPHLYKELIGKGFAVKEGYVPPVPFDSETFNVIFASMVLEHMSSYKEALELLNESYRVLKSKGIVCIIVPNYLREKSAFFEMDYTHNFITTKGRIQSMLYDTNFEMVYCTFFIGPTTGILRNLLKLGTFFIYWEIISGIFEAINKEDFLINIKKNLSEAVMLIGRKVD